MVFAAIGVIGAFFAEARIFGQIKQTEAALRKSEGRFRDLIENASLGIQISTRDSRRLFANQAYAERFGYDSPEEIMALPPFALVATYDRERLRLERQDLLDGKPTPPSHEYDAVRKNGSTIRLESFGRQLVWQGEDAVQNTYVDVTRQRHAEADLKEALDHLELRVEERTAELRFTNAALRESEQRYRGLVELSKDGIVVRGHETYLYANQAAASFLEVPSPDLMIGRRWLDFVHPDDQGDATRRFASFLKNEGAAPIVVRRMRGKDGTDIVLEICATAITWQGKPAVLGLWRNITERTRAEGELRDRFRRQFRSGPVPTYLWQWKADDFIRIEENDAATELKGGRTRKNDGRMASQIYSTWPEGLQCMKKCFEERTTIRHMGLRPSLAPRGPRWAQTNFVFIPPDLVMVHVVDIDEQKRSEEELRAAKEKAERANTAKSRFLAAASHDLRRPLQALEFSVATLEERVRDPKAREIIANVDRSIGFMEDLLNALLDMSNLEAGVVEPHVEDFPVSRILENTGRTFAPLAADQGIELCMVPSQAIVRSDPALLERIVQNFTATAIRHSDAGKILLGCRHTNGSLRIEVHDSGKGISPHEQK